MTHTLLDKHMLILLMTADTRLSQTELRVGIVLLEYYNQQTGAAWPSHNTMAGDIGVHRTTAIRAVNGLIEKGYFKLLERGGFHKSSRYRPRFEAVAQPLLGSSSDAPWWLQQRTEVVAPALHESSYQPGFKTGVDNEGDPPAGAAPRGAPAKEEFGRFWIAYPKKQHRQDAEVTRILLSTRRWIAYPKKQHRQDRGCVQQHHRKWRGNGRRPGCRGGGVCDCRQGQDREVRCCACKLATQKEVD